MTVTASTLPVARVLVDMPLAHLDRGFDYAVPESMDADAQPGVRVRVRFAGRLVDGFIAERLAHSDAPKLASLERVISSQVAITPSQIALVRAVADHYAASFADVVRMAVAPRHGATEKAQPRPWPEPQLPQLSGALLEAAGADGFLAALREGKAPRAWWQVPPVSSQAGDLNSGVLQAVIATLVGGRSAVVVVPDAREVSRMVAAFEAVLGRGTVAALHADVGPSTRYRSYLACLRGQARVVVGTRSAVFAPMPHVGLVVVVDDGDDLHSSPQTPYPHTRTVAALRVPIDDCALLMASHSCSGEVAAWMQRGWMHPLQLDRPQLRRASPRIVASADTDQALERDPLAAQVRLPALAFQTIRTGLTRGPVLVQVPRVGHLVVLVCERCRSAVRCQQCSGPVSGDPNRVLTCQQCGRVQQAHPCPNCHHRGWRAPVVGAGLTAQQLGRAFPGVRVLDSSADHVVDRVGPEPALVVATPGAEPIAEGGYATAVLLDATSLLRRADLRAGEEALRRWLNAAALVASGELGGTVAIIGPADDSTIQAFIRVDPRGFAERELADRATAGLPPAVRMITLEGTPAGVRELIEHAGLDQLSGVEVLGPVEVSARARAVGGELDDLVKMTIRAPSALGGELTAAVKAGLAVRSARKGLPVRVRVDPIELG